MKPIAVPVLLAALGLALAAQAQPAPGGPKPQRTTDICLDVSGATLPVVCKVPSSRLDKREDICVCPQGMRTTVPVCGPDETQPSETVALNAARRTAARDGSLVGDLFRGGPMCVELRN